MPDIAPTGTPAELLKLIRWNDQGLVAVIAQDRGTGDVLMFAWANAEAVTSTLATRKATYFSRSRGRLWVKGETSGFIQQILEVRIDCDGDCLLYVVEAPGAACHQLRRSCFSHRVEADGSVHTDKPVIT